MKPNRIAYIDNIKVFLTCLVVAHHAAQAYGPTGGVWVVDDPLKAQWLGKFFFINASYMMGLYFFISGYFMVFSIRNKTATVFLRDRLKRLGIPLLFFTFLVFLPFNYLGADKPGNLVNFLLDTYFNKPPIATGHLWFVASLLAYSIFYLVCCHKLFLKWASGNRSLKVWHLLVFAAIIILFSALIRTWYPIDAWRTWIIPIEPAHLPQYLFLFLAGNYFHHANWLKELNWKHALPFIVLTVIGYNTSNYWIGSAFSQWISEPLLETLLCFSISISLMVGFRQGFNQTNSLMKILSDNAYGIYLVHLLLVIALQLLVLKLNWNPNLKFIVVTVAGIGSSLLVSHLLRKIPAVKRII